MTSNWPLAIGFVLCITPALADDEACRKAAHDHTDFKAIISDDDSGKPQYEIVQRAPDNVVIVTRYVAGQKRLVRHTLFGLFSRENEIPLAGDSKVRFGMSHSIDVAKLIPLKPHSSASYRTTTVRVGTFVPQSSDVTLTVGDTHPFALGGCALQVIDITVETRTAATAIVATFKGMFSPDLAYPVDSSVEIVNKATVNTYVTKLREIQAP